MQLIIALLKLPWEYWSKGSSKINLFNDWFESEIKEVHVEGKFIVSPFNSSILICSGFVFFLSIVVADIPI